jgi:large subunit ribosomal protein L48
MVGRKTFEPDYLDSAVPQIPTYPEINIQMKGYDFDILESYQSFVHNLVENIGVNVSDAWVTPAKSYKLSTYLPGGTRIKTEYNLNIYERNVQVTNLRSIDAPVLIDSIRAGLPTGVQLSLHLHQQEDYEERFIPDPFINSIRTELAAGDEQLLAAREEKDAVNAAKAARKQAAILQSLEDDE